MTTYTLTYASSHLTKIRELVYDSIPRNSEITFNLHYIEDTPIVHISNIPESLLDLILITLDKFMLQDMKKNHEPMET